MSSVATLMHIHGVQAVPSQVVWCARQVVCATIRVVLALVAVSAYVLPALTTCPAQPCAVLSPTNARLVLALDVLLSVSAGLLNPVIGHVVPVVVRRFEEFPLLQAALPACIFIAKARGALV